MIGNCGFGVAPTRPAHRDLILRTLESVEGMSLEALRAGLGADWPFESFPEYLGAIEAQGVAINVAALVGHTPLRTYVMGEDAVRREATADEVAAMRRLTLEALEAGALGFATSKSPTHVGYAGQPGAEPRRLLRRDRRARERPRRGAARRHAGHDRPRPLLRRVRGRWPRRTGKPVSWTALLSGFWGPKGHRGILERHAKLQAEGDRA